MTAPARPGKARTALLALVASAAVVGGAAGVSTVLGDDDPAVEQTTSGALSVGDAFAAQDGGEATVEGYVVGQPTAQDTVVSADFPSDFAVALAESAGETDTDAMLYVQVPADFRAEWGLASSPATLGARVAVTGSLSAYFSHAGLVDVTDVALVEGGAAPADPSETVDPAEESDEPEPGEVPALGAFDGYYDGLEGLSGALFEAELTRVISDADALSYDDVWDALRETDEDPSAPGNVVELYTGRSIPAFDNGGDPGEWNREHVWAKSKGDFGTSRGPGTDLHHLRPTDVEVNARRGSLDFDEGGAPVAGCDGCFADGDSFEPPDRVKGDVARMIFYMAVRWEGGDGWPDLEVDDETGGFEPFHGRLSALLAWHEQDPVDAREELRNDRIQQIQGNRNPFIDHPEWVADIWG